MKKTKWRLKSVHPTIKGWYEVRPLDSQDIYMSYWYGDYWGLLCVEAYQPSDCKDTPTGVQFFQWRGLASPQVE